MVWDSGVIDAESSFARDQTMMALAAADDLALLTCWRRPCASIGFGRFHRLPVPAPSACERRISGGRALPFGPGVLGVTLVIPCVDWLDRGAAPLRPDQVLNRALRPLLACLRDIAGDVFYPGRDLVTLDQRPIAHASFTVTSDGVCIVEMHVAASDGFGILIDVLALADPAGVAAISADMFSDAPSLSELVAGAAAATVLDGVDTEDWLHRLTTKAAEVFNCEIVLGLPVALLPASIREGRDDAYEAFLRERGPLPEDAVSAATVSMLGTVEVSARQSAGRIHDLEISGDLIAPFHTLEAIAAACEGQPCKGPLTRRRLTSVLSRSRNFLLGCHDLDALVVRLGEG